MASCWQITAIAPQLDRLAGSRPHVRRHNVQQSSRTRIWNRQRVLAAAASKQELTADVVIVGAGIIGLLAAQELLKHKLSVVLVERKQPCAGATGAGQGYLWMSHRTVDTVAWELAAASTRLWRHTLAGDPDLACTIEWQETGSLLLASNAHEAQLLSERAHVLSRHGVQAQLLTAHEVQQREPALRLAADGAGLLVQTDGQINGRKTAAALLAACRAHANFKDLLDEPVQRLELGAGALFQDNPSHAVHTEHRVLHGRVATVVAAGVWTGQLLAQATQDALWQAAFLPRRGHLLEVEPPPGMPPLHLGTMEMSYTKNYAPPAGQGAPPGTSSPAATPQPPPQQPHHHQGSVDITFTATTSAAGTLLVGSSREVGPEVAPEAQPDIVRAIMRRAAHFLPALEACKPPEGAAVRVGPRPYAVGGLPIIGPVKGHAGLYVAAGHEGSGLTLGPATATLLGEYVRHQHQQQDVPHAAAERGSLQDLAHWQELTPDVRLLVAGL